MSTENRCTIGLVSCRLCHSQRGSGPGRCDREAGNGTIAVLGIIGVLVSLMVGALVLTSAVLATHRSHTAADLAALAGATRIQTGASAENACQVADQTASINGAVLTCRVEGEHVWVEARVRPSLLPAAQLGDAVATAHAGPDVSDGRSGR